MTLQLNGIWWLLLTLGPLLFLQRRLHREIQAILLLITRRMDLTLALFSLIFLPGVLVHEVSHYLMARLLGVRTGRFSIFPQPLQDGRLQMGYVETARTDLVRDALIGAAPFFTGGLIVTYVGLIRMGLYDFWQVVLSAEAPTIAQNLLSLPKQADFWVWFYIVFTVSSTMLPSASDRRAWLPLGIGLALLFLVSILVGAGPWLLENASEPFNLMMSALATVMGISAVVHLILWIPTGLLHLTLSRITGYEVT